MTPTSTTPHHVAIIMDGNGRWAQAQGKERTDGHFAGADAVLRIVQTAAKSGVKVLTLYTFSEENWNRPVAEVDALMQLLVSSLRKQMNELNKNQVRFSTIGDLSRLPASAQEIIAEAEELTLHNDRLQLVLALSYSAHHEITHAAQRLASQVAQGSLRPEEINTDTLGAALYRPDLPHPDLLIRTGGECRISNFLLWQLAYTELYFCDTYWPDFGPEQFELALADYSRRQRRFGKTSAQITAKADPH